MVASGVKWYFRKPTDCSLMQCRRSSRVFFFFQAEDGIRDLTVTGVQTCALPILIDSLLKLHGYRITQYVADTLIVQGGDTQTIHLRGEAYVEREGTKLESDSIRYHQRSCRLDAIGDPRLFDQATVMVGEGMRYDTCI